MIEQVPEAKRFFGKAITVEPGVLVIARIIKAAHAIGNGIGNMITADKIFQRRAVEEQVGVGVLLCNTVIAR